MAQALADSYHDWRASTLGAVTDRIEENLLLELSGTLPNRRVLDAGCGDGALAKTLADEGARGVGLDLSFNALAAARRRSDRLVDLVQGNVLELPFRAESFDLVVAVTVLCFVCEPAKAVAEMTRVLRPGGRLVLGELGRWSTWAALRRVKGWLGSETWKIAAFRTPGELGDLARSSGLNVVEVRGAVYYPPLGVLARVLAPFDPWRARLGPLGAAFLGLVAEKPVKST